MDTPQEGCIVAEIEVVLDGAADDMHVEEYEITSLGMFELNDALAEAAGYEGVIFQTLVPLGTCDDIRECAKRANKGCRDMGQGKARTATINLEGTSCSYTCTGGDALWVVIVCADPDPPEGDD